MHAVVIYADHGLLLLAMPDSDLYGCFVPRDQQAVDLVVDRYDIHVVLPSCSRGTEGMALGSGCRQVKFQLALREAKHAGCLLSTRSGRMVQDTSKPVAPLATRWHAKTKGFAVFVDRDCLIRLVKTLKIMVCCYAHPPYSASRIYCASLLRHKQIHAQGAV